MLMADIAHIAGLVEGGARGPLPSTVPPFSGPAWATFMTGLQPGGHGLFDFVMEDQIGAVMPIEVKFRRSIRSEDFAGLLTLIKKRASHLGGTSGQYFLRTMGVDSFVLSKDVVRALIREGVVDKAPTSQRDLAKVQEAFNRWRKQSGRSLSEISRTLACSIE